MARLLITFILCWCGLSFAVTPGLDSRAIVGAYLNGALPSTAANAMPALLSQTGAFSDMATRTPIAGLVPYELNSPLWTDGALKSRFIALPYDGTANSPTITFAPTGSWVFPNGTVIVKNFDMVVDEQNNTVRRLETRLLVRNADGTLRGATYKWNPAQTEATRVDTAGGELEVITITGPTGTTRTQGYFYPDPDQCLRCHNTNAGLVLGIRTAQLNRDLLYTQTGRTDNQLHTFSSLGMFNTALPDTSTYPQLDKMAAVTETTATLEHRVRSYLSSNCGHCHRGRDSQGILIGEGTLFDARFETPILSQNIVSNGGFGALIRRNLAASRLYVRDSITVVPFAPPPLPGQGPMPPIARNIPDPDLLATYDAWVNDPYDIVLVQAQTQNAVFVTFSRPFESLSATNPANYSLNNGASVLQAAVHEDYGSTIVLTTTPLSSGITYSLAVNRVKEFAPPQNPIWPNTVAMFSALPATVPGAPTITSTQAADGRVTLLFSAPPLNGGAPISSYNARCTVGAITITAFSGSLSITVTGLTNGIAYSCSVTATNAVGTGPASNSLSVTPIAPVAPKLSQVMSQKIHGLAGAFDLQIDVPQSSNGPTVEPRASGSGHTVIFRFDIPITVPGDVTLVQSSPAGGATATALASGQDVRVTLTGVTDNQRVTISLAAINGVPNASASATIGFLIGDVNNTRAVNSSDILGVKARAGQAISTTNFMFDVNASGRIDAADLSVVRARSGLTLP